MRVLVTGANGQLGRDLTPLLEAAGHTIYGATRKSEENPMEITDFASVAAQFEQFQPDAVIHAAAHTNVDDCERNPDNAHRVNALGTWNIATLAGEANIPLIYVSTDFVFDGAKTTPYTEYDAVNPLNHYGASKLAGEKHVAQLCRKHFIARTSWLFGAHGMNFPRRMLELAQTRKELTVIADQIGSPTHTLDLAGVLVSLLASQHYGTYHVSNSGECSWYQFAQKTLELAGVQGVNVRPIRAADWQSPTRRPPYSVLRNFALELQGYPTLPHWETALAGFLARIS